MSWLNNLKGQLSTLAQEVLAEAIPGDQALSNEYEQSGSTSSSDKAEIDQLRRENEELSNLRVECSNKESEIVKLKKQIAELLNQKTSSSEDGNNTTGRTSKSPIESNATFEDSWCWELDKTEKPDNEHSSEESSGGNSSEMVNITLEESTTSKNAKRTQRKVAIEEYAALQERFQKLEVENKELNAALEELDTQHNLAIQNVLELKTNLQQKLNAVTKDYDNLKKEHDDKFINSELELAKLKKQLESLETALRLSEEDNQTMRQKIDEDAVELKKSYMEIADLQALLEKKTQDNVELIERIKSVSDEMEQAAIERDSLNLKVIEMGKEFEDLKNRFKEKKTSESSTTSTTSKHSDDEFIVVREGDAGLSSGPTTPPTKEELKDKIVQLENRVSELTLENGSLELKVQEGEKEIDETRRRLETEIQELKLHYEALKSNADQNTEKDDHHSDELEEKLKSVMEENESLRVDLDNISRAAEKQKVTDLDADDEEEPFKVEKLRELLESFAKQNFTEPNELDVEEAYRALRSRLWKIDTLEKSLAQMSEEIIELQDSKLVWDHEKKTLEADISQYILQCDELMKNNEVLLNELENLKRNKLETIPENNEENLLQLELQLDEVNKLNNTLEQEYAELNEKCEELEREKQLITEKLRSAQQANEKLINQEMEYKIQLENLELEKSNLAFELDELKSEETRSEINDEHEQLKAKFENLEQQLSRLSKDHADLVAAMQAQKASLVDVGRKREEAEKNLSKQESLIKDLREEIDQKNNELRAQQSAKDQEIQTNQKTLENLRGEIAKLQRQVEESETLRTTNEMLEQKLLENQEFLERLQRELQDKSTKEDCLQSELNELQRAQELNENSESKSQDMEALQIEFETLQRLYREQSAELESLSQKSNENSLEKSNELTKRIAELEAQLITFTELQRTVETLNFEKNEMIKGLHQKHAENVQYYNEIQRLTALVEQYESESEKRNTAVCEKCTAFETTLSELRAEQDKLKDQINFLKEKSDILTTNLLTEQTNQKLIRQEKAEVEEQNAAIRKDLERLREHLLEVEEMHTQETVQMQRELEETKTKMIALQEEVSKSSTAYTSASIRANQQAETLQAQYALLVQQRDDLVVKLSLAEDRELKNQAALCNLQCALEQFQNDKEQDIKAATQRIRKELQLELDKEAQLQSEIVKLQQQLNDANQGLHAASRLSDQLEIYQQTIAALREEVETMKEQNIALEQKLKNSESSQADKIEKNLIKSLLIGYIVSHNPNDKNQVLRMISSVLDFSQSESDKIGLNKQQQSSWLGAILGGGPVDSQEQHSKDNLIQAFVQFLEKESQPKDNSNDMPNLLNITQRSTSSAMVTATSATGATPISTRSSVSGASSSNISNNSPAPLPIQPLLFNSNILNEFAPTRNSSSILKDILSDS